MEYIWCLIASIGAGVGTGLAGLSAATVMVPILLVLCPSFAGANGAYQATAIALASDVFGSALTSAIYIRHKNIDLKHGWIMMACIVGMCVAGSVAAWYAGNVVLGTFSLFLTFFIGIRFLVKPDTQRKETISDNQRLGAKEIAVSLFFGLTIGFGTGFFGTGGGMMMLIVFTAFLRMDLKSAVGTSTLIMTFTALIASVSHIVIHPAIITERTDILLLCMVVTTVASAVSAQFANRVKNRTVGLCTGAVLTVLGAAMLLIHYRDAVFGNALVMDTLRCFGQFILVIIVAAAVLIAVNFLISVPRELFRKLLHGIAFMMTPILEILSDRWLPACLCAALFGVLVYPALNVAEKWRGYSDLLVQRRKGEVKQSLLLLSFTSATLIAVGWGWLNQPWLPAAATLMWGFGDASAALIGKRFGQHKVRLPLADQKKSWEGSGAMAAVSTAIGFAYLTLLHGFAPVEALLLSLPAGLVGAWIELITHRGYDTITVPFANTAVLALLTLLIG